ncbi:MAG: hypothetical protein R3F19_34405 [Verrucomicrobiales bacterium]
MFALFPHWPSQDHFPRGKRIELSTHQTSTIEWQFGLAGKIYGSDREDIRQGLRESCELPHHQPSRHVLEE